MRKSVAAVLGFFLYKRIAPRGTKGKALGLAVVMALFAATFSLSKHYVSDATLIDRDWDINTTGLLHFELPYELELSASGVPTAMSGIYKELDVYLHNDRGRICYLYNAELVSLERSARELFDGGLNSMLNATPHRDLELAFLAEELDYVAAYIRFTLPNDDVVDGFGMVYEQEGKLQMLWLMPQERGFSKAFLDHFLESLERP